MNRKIDYRGKNPLHGKNASLVALLEKNPPAIWETWAQSLVWEDPLEKGTAPTLVFWSEEFHGRYSPWGKRAGHDWATFPLI